MYAADFCVNVTYGANCSAYIDAVDMVCVCGQQQYLLMRRVGQNTVYVQCFWQGYHHIYSHIRYTVCDTVLTNPMYAHWAKCEATRPSA